MKISRKAKNSRSDHNRHRFLRVEQLESRELLAALAVTKDNVPVDVAAVFQATDDGYYEDLQGIEKYGGGTVAYSPLVPHPVGVVELPDDPLHSVLLGSQGDNLLIRSLRDVIIQGNEFLGVGLDRLNPGLVPPYLNLFGATYDVSTSGAGVSAPVPETLITRDAMYSFNGQSIVYLPLNSDPGFASLLDPSTVLVSEFSPVEHNNQVYFFGIEEDNGSLDRLGYYGLAAGNVSLIQTLATSTSSQATSFHFQTSAMTSTSQGTFWAGGPPSIAGDSSFASEPYMGPNLLKDIKPGPGASNPAFLADTGNQVFFSADDGTHGRELWVTNGTTGGTQMVKDINPGSEVDPTNNGSNPGDGVVFNGKVYFAATDGVHGYALWVSDGTDAGTHMVVDLNPGGGDGFDVGQYVPPNLTPTYALDDGILFPGNDGSGIKLWQSDGTADGTVKVADINLSTGGGLFRKFDNRLFVSASDGLYIANFLPNTRPTVTRNIPDQTAIAGYVYDYTIPADIFQDADASQGDTLRYFATLGDGSPLPSWLTFNPTHQEFYTAGTVPAGEVGHHYTIQVKVRDRGNASVVMSFDFTVSSPTPHAPYVDQPLKEATVTAQASSVFVYIQPHAFRDPDEVTGDTLTLTATQADGSALPSWLSFASPGYIPGGGYFIADNAPYGAADVNVVITATDSTNRTATDPVVIHVYSPPPLPPADVVYVSQSFFQYPYGPNDPDGSGPATQFGYDAFNDIQAAIDAVADGGTVVIGSGFYFSGGGQSGPNGTGEGGDSGVGGGGIANNGKPVTIALGGLEPDAIGNVTVLGNVLLDADSTLQLKLYESPDGGDQYDQLTIFGSLTLNGPTLNLRAGTPTFGGSGLATISPVQAFQSLTGQFINAPENELIATAAGPFQAHYAIDAFPLAFQLAQVTDLAPTAENDSYSTNQGQMLAVTAPGVLSNDSSGGSTLTINSHTDPSHGTIELHSDGSFIYTPDPTFIGADSFTYLANDGTADSNIAAVTINVIQPTVIQFTGDPAPVFEDGADNLVYTLTRTGSYMGTLHELVVVGLSGTADPSSDFTVSGAQFTATYLVDFPAGIQTAQLVVDPTADSFVEADETVTLTLLPRVDSTLADAYTVGATASATGTIQNDDTLAQVSISDLARSEGTGQASSLTTFSFTVTLSHAVAWPVTVNYGTVDGAAQANTNDYEVQAGTITFAPGTTTASIKVMVIGDALVEGDETFFVNLSDARIGGIADPATLAIADSQAQGTIQNDDTLAQVNISDLALAEGTAQASVLTTFSFTVTLSHAVAWPVTVNYGTVDGTAGAGTGDYQVQAGTITFAPGTTTASIRVMVIGDVVDEGDETFFVNLNDARIGGIADPATVAIADSQAQGTILNDDSSAGPSARIDENHILIVTGMDVAQALLTGHTTSPSGNLAGASSPTLGDDRIQVSLNGKSQAVTVAIKSYPSNSLSFGPFKLADFDSIRIEALGGNDSITIDKDLTKPTVLFGGPGNDTMRGGSGNDTIIDLDGDNEIRSGAGNDVITVGDGANKIWTDGGSDSVTAGNGNNDIHASQGMNAIRVGNGNNQIWTSGGMDSIIAGDGANEIHSGGQSDALVIGNGNNTIWSAADADSITAGNGNNTIYSGAGDDTIIVGGGNNTISGGSGDDTITVGGGSNTIKGEAGNDRITIRVDGIGVNLVDGGSGDDRIYGGSGKDTIDGGAGNDILVGGAGDDTIIGGAGRDILIGGTGADNLTGDKDEDLLVAGYTAFDSNDLALVAIMQEWSSGSSYANRVAHLGGIIGGLNGTTFLRGNDVGNQTVFDDNTVGILAGSQGMDWLLANIVTDNSLAKDIISDLANGETASDIDLDLL